MASADVTIDTGLTCSWDVDLSRCCPDPTNDVDAATIEAAEKIAVAILMRRSGFTVGLCNATIRPLGPCPVCRRFLCCGSGDWIHLSGPYGMRVDSVTQVRIGADPVPPESWYFDADTQTLWTVPPMMWPNADERWSAPGAGDAFTVDAVVGSPPDPWALDVAASLTCELVKSCRNEKCRLPRNATQVTGQGITVRLSDSQVTDMLPEVTAWLAAVNPFNAMLPAAVWSPDVTPLSRRTGQNVPQTRWGPWGGY